MMPVSLRAVRFAEAGIFVGCFVIALTCYGFIAAGGTIFWSLSGVALLLEAVAYYMHDQYRWALTDNQTNKKRMNKK